MSKSQIHNNYYFNDHISLYYKYSSGVARAPQAPLPRGARGVEGARQGPARKK